jgi:acyl-CoA reductase-like NAD-dependent aldehyde dehydrogenase
MAVKKTTNPAPTAKAAAPIVVAKTYKLYIGGAFPRTESGRYTELRNPDGRFLANVSRASRKDFRNAVVAARAAQEGWQDRSAYNRSQIVYRIAEMLQQREALFTDEMESMGYTPAAAREEFQQSVDYIVHMAGWCDKYTQVYSAVNPVASSHFNFTVPEPMGVVAAVAPEHTALLGVLSATLPAVCGGNTVVVLASAKYPLCAVSLAEVLATSDLPGGVVNILTGLREELLGQMATHMDVNALTAWDVDQVQHTDICREAADNVKRAHVYSSEAPPQAIDLLMHLQEMKTTWHPIEVIKSAGSGY